MFLYRCFQKYDESRVYNISLKEEKGGLIPPKYEMGDSYVKKVMNRLNKSGYLKPNSTAPYACCRMMPNWRTVLKIPQKIL